MAARDAAEKLTKRFSLRKALRAAHGAAKRGKAGAAGILTKLLGY